MVKLSLFKHIYKDGIMKLSKSIFIIVTIVLVAVGCAQKEMAIPEATDWPIKEFSFTNQEGDAVSLSDLKGKVWIADFIFTNCADVCLPMTSNMKKLQTMVAEEQLKNVEFISFSVDPAYDKPKILKDYGNRFKADYTNWNLLTGYSQKEIETFAKDNFKAHVMKPKEGDQVVHGTSFYLVDQKGTVVKQYTGLQDIPLEEIIKHIKILQSK